MTESRRRSLPNPLFAIVVVSLPLTIGAGGCGRDAHLADENVRHVVVKTVRDQGVTLDRDADPRRVAYVLLRALRDDVLAGDERAPREAALQRTLDTCAPEAIVAQYKKLVPHPVHSPDQIVHKVVRLWAPTVAYYVDQLDLSLESLESKLRVSYGAAAEGSEPTTAVVTLALADPHGDANAGVFLLIGLAHEDAYWRAYQLGYYTARPKAAG